MEHKESQWFLHETLQDSMELVRRQNVGARTNPLPPTQRFHKNCYKVIFCIYSNETILYLFYILTINSL